MQSHQESRRLQQATNDIEALYGLMSDTRDRVDQISAKLLEHDERFTQIDKRFEQIDGHFEQVDKELGGLRTDVRQILEILKSR